MTRRLSRHGLSCLLAWLLCASLYFWTAQGVSSEYGDRNNAWHHYEYLVEGFLSGHLYVSRLPAPELLALTDPYNPQANENYRMWDATLFKGKYYLYYGPTPALLLMLPWKVVTGHHLPQWAATATFAVAGLGALTALLAAVARRCFPTATPGRLFIAVVLAGHLSWLPVILRRPAFWELPIVTAVALFWFSLYSLWRFHAGQRRSHWAAIAGIALAAALGARPTYLFPAALVGLAFTLPWTGGRSLLAFAKSLVPVAIPLLVGGLSLLAYNSLRFGQPFEFGNRYQLWGMDERTVSHFSPANVGFNTWVYFFSLPEFSPYFPFLRTVATPQLPTGYIATEEMPGLLFTMPALLLGLIAWSQVLRRTPGSANNPLRLLVLTATACSLTTAALLFCFAGACSRYIAELAGGWTVIVGIGWLALGGAQVVAPARPYRLAVYTAAAWSVIGVWLASFEFRNVFRATEPAVYRVVATLLNYPSDLYAQFTNREFGPVVIDIRLSETFARTDTVVLSSGRAGMLNKLVVERLAPNRVRISVGFNDTTLFGTGVMAHEGNLIRLELHTPWLYPPREHPYWSRFTDPAQRRRLQANTVLATSAGTILGESNWYCDPADFEPNVSPAHPERPGSAWIEKLVHLDPEKSIAGSPAAERPPGVKPPGPARAY